VIALLRLNVFHLTCSISFLYTFSSIAIIRHTFYERRVPIEPRIVYRSECTRKIFQTPGTRIVSSDWGKPTWNPHTLRPAGMSQAMHNSAHWTSFLCSLIFTSQPSHISRSSFTKSFKKGMMSVSSMGPRINPQRIIFFLLIHTERGKFSINM